MAQTFFLYPFWLNQINLYLYTNLNIIFGLPHGFSVSFFGSSLLVTAEAAVSAGSRTCGTSRCVHGMYCIASNQPASSGSQVKSPHDQHDVDLSQGKETMPCTSAC